MSRNQRRSENMQLESNLRNRNRNNNDEKMRIRNLTLRDYFQVEDELRNKRYTDEIKLSGNIRILSLNPHRYKPTEVCKMSNSQKAIKKYDIDIIMMSETNIK